jgi:signal transduction histidine kinase
MSGAGAQLAPCPPGEILQGRSPLAHLLHALNQPLTGLQCSLELAMTGSRSRSEEQYIRTLREGLELTERMRILVEAIRELADPQPAGSQPQELVLLDELVRATAGDLQPVAETMGVRLVLDSAARLPVRTDRSFLATLLFRFFESALSLARAGSALQIAAALEPEHARLMVSWCPGKLPEHSPFSRQELGLLVVQAAWERAGAEWTFAAADVATADITRTCTVRLPLVL